MSFDWQTEEESAWEDPAWQEKSETAVPPSRPWLTIILIAVVVFAVGAFGYRQINQRLIETTTAVESDIFAAHNLLSRAAANQDADLGKAVLSGRDIGWSRIQADLLSAGLFYEHPGLGLRLPEEEESAYAPLFREDERFIDLTLSPDLNGAELRYARDYLALTDDGVELVTLEQTAVYRRGETRWLLSPPVEEFWGDWQTRELDNLTLIYPQRDEETMQKLADDLQALLQESCDLLPELACEAPIQIRFDTNAESLLESADLANLYDGNLRLDLPTPTLIGLPINNAGYEALRIAYGVNLVSALIGHSLAYDCCQQAPFYQAILTYQLSKLGLAEWPVTPELYLELAENGVRSGVLLRYWNSDDFSLAQDAESGQLFSFVDFLLKKHAPQMSPLALMSQMSRSRTLQSWLAELSQAALPASSTSIEAISRDWWFYTLMQSEILAASNRPIPLPAQDLQVSCLGVLELEQDVFAQTSLYRYDLGSSSWAEEFKAPAMAFFNPLPQDNGVILQLVQDSEEELWQTLWWHNGRGMVMSSGEELLSISLGQMDPNGRFLLTYVGFTDDFLPTSQLVDMAACEQGECRSTPIMGTPYWSPNGQQTLLTDRHLFESPHYVVDGRIIAFNAGSMNQTANLWLANAEADPQDSEPIGQGFSPFWLTDTLFGFIYSVPQTDLPIAQELVVMSPDELELRQVVQTADLQAQIPEPNRQNQLFMRYAIAYPADPNLVLVMAATQGLESYLFQVDIQARAVKMLFQLDLSRGEHALSFSPDGRFLTATGAVWQDTTRSNNTLPLGGLHLYNLETSEHKILLVNSEGFFPTFTFDWSQDGTWLAFLRDSNVIGLYAPDHDYQEMILQDVGSCTSLAWINPLPSE
jgi:hypothetical protein